MLSRLLQELGSLLVKLCAEQAMCACGRYAERNALAGRHDALAR